MDLWYFNLVSLLPILVHQAYQFRGIQFAIAPFGFHDMALLLEREVLPRESWINDLFIQTQYLVMRYSSRIREVHDASFSVLGQNHDYRQEVVQDAVRVGDVDDALVFGDLRHEGAAV